MRKPFAYESNVSLIRRILVPDPLREGEWAKTLKDWESSGRRHSLLEWIILRGNLEEERIMATLSAFTGARLHRDSIQGTGKSPPAERGILESHGFHYLTSSGKPFLVAGGSSLPPDLERFIGDRARDWEWVILSPRREGKTPTKNINPRTLALSPSRPEAWLKALLIESQLREVTDIHFELKDGELTIRTRNREGMRKVGEWPGPLSMECLRLLKRWANFSTADTSLPQDGRIQLSSGANETSFRASHLRTVDGESLVLRIIGADDRIPSLAGLGVPSELEKIMTESMLMDAGLMLCTGATGSGKTTTLCSLLDSLNPRLLKILTIEDPVERDIEGAVQSSVNESVGWTFAHALRAYLRQDPDVIMIGEIRDRESAEMACRASLTGHAVVASLHANALLTALVRLAGWRIPPGILAESLRLITHQKLEKEAGSSRWKGRFIWLRPAPDDTHTFLATGKIPAGWESSIPLQGLGEGSRPMGIRTSTCQSLWRSST